MKLQKYNLLVTLFFTLIILVLLLINFPFDNSQFKIKFNGNYTGETSQIFFDIGNGFSEENSFKNIIYKDEVLINIDKRYKKVKSIRLDPITSPQTLYIKKFELYQGNKKINEWNTEEIKSYINNTLNVNSINIYDGCIEIVSDSSDMNLFLNSDFIEEYNNSLNSINFKIRFILILLSTIIWFIMIKFKKCIKDIFIQVHSNKLIKKLIDGDQFIYIIILFISAMYLFKDIIVGGYKLSYTNILYSMPPFNSMGVNILGPLLSDVCDQFLPNLYSVFVNVDFLNFWNSYNGFGFENVWLETILNPLNYVYLLGIKYGQLLKYILEFTVAFSGMYLFLKDIKYKKVSVFVGSITYTFSSVMVLWGGWPHSDVTCMAPFLFWSVNRYLDKSVSNKSKYLLIFTFILYLMLVAGMPVYVAYFLYLGFIYTIYKLFLLYKKEYKKMLLLALPLIISIAISGTMSFVYTGNIFFNTSDYQSERLSQSFSTLDLCYLRTIIFPYWREALSIHTNESTLFTGLLILFIFPFIFSKKDKCEKKELYFWLNAMIIILIFIFTKESGNIFKKLPLINTSLKIRIIVLFNFVVSVLSCILLEYLSKIYNKKQRIFLTILTFIIPLFTTIYFYNAKNKEIINTLLILWIMSLNIILIINSVKKKNSFIFVLAFIVSFHMFDFAKNYMPLIDKSADVIPNATESIEFLQNNQTNMDRSMALGKWNFSPNTNALYGIKDIRAHDFINTKKDMREYLSAIDSNFYDSNTRTSLKYIENYNLLSYASVKYILKTNQNDTISIIDEKIKKEGTKRLAYTLDGVKTNKIEQIFIASNDNLSEIGILLSTYEKTLSNSNQLYITIENCEKNTIVYNESVLLSEIKDNSIHSVKFDLIKDSADKKFKITLEVKEALDDPLAIWITEKPYVNGLLYMDEISTERSLVFNDLYYNTEKNLYSFSDNEVIEELNEYSPRAFIANNLEIRDDDDEILQDMINKYIANTLFITSDEYNNFIDKDKIRLNKNTNGDIKIIEDRGEFLCIEANVDNSCFMVLNDYYDDNWIAYIDGKETDILQANYLFRAIYIPEGGEHKIVFKYRPNLLYMCIAITFLGYMIFIVLFINRKRIDKYINKIMEG